MQFISSKYQQMKKKKKKKKKKIGGGGGGGGGEAEVHDFVFLLKPHLFFLCLVLCYAFVIFREFLL